MRTEKLMCPPFHNVFLMIFIEYSKWSKGIFAGSGQIDTPRPLISA